jgi:hypothetical protein
MVTSVVEQPLRSAQARRLILAVLNHGTVVFTGHAEAELAKDGLTTVDAVRALRGGVVDEAEWENGTWRHHVRTPRITVVVELESDLELVVVTAWRSER